MSEPTIKTNQTVEVVVSDDRLTASVRHRDRSSLPDPVAITEALQQAGVVVNETVAARVAAYCERAADDAPDDEPCVVAKGQACVEGRDEEFIWDEAFGRGQVDPESDAAVDYYTFNSIITVSENTRIGRIVPLREPRNGMDVYGETIRPAHQPVSIELDNSVRRDPNEPEQIITNVAGRVVSKAGRLYIDEVLDIKGDVDFSVGKVDSSIDVNVSGTVRDRFAVKSVKCISIGGAVEAAMVEAGEDVAVRGGIVSRNEGRVVAQGNVGARFCDEADIRAGGDVLITRELMNCRVFAAGRLMSERGSVIGGNVYARQGGEIATIGSDANVHTRMAIGTHPIHIREAEAIDRGIQARLDVVRKVREKVQPLMANIKRLAPAQKEQATELLFKADEAEMQIKAESKRREELLGGGAECKLRVTKIIYPGVTLSIGPRATVIQREIKGPIVIESRKVENVTEIVAVNPLTGSVTVLPNTILPTNDLLKGFEEAAPFIRGESERDEAAPKDEE